MLILQSVVLPYFTTNQFSSFRSRLTYYFFSILARIFPPIFIRCSWYVPSQHSELDFCSTHNHCNYIINMWLLKQLFSLPNLYCPREQGKDCVLLTTIYIPTTQQPPSAHSRHSIHLINEFVNSKASNVGLWGTSQLFTLCIYRITWKPISWFLTLAGTCKGIQKCSFLRH